MCCQIAAAIPFPLFIGVQAVSAGTMLDGHPAGSPINYRQRFGRVLCSMTVCSVILMRTVRVIRRDPAR